MTSSAVFLIKSLPPENDLIIRAGTAGFVISKEYLERSPFSPDDHDQLLRDAEQAHLFGLFCVHFPTYGKCCCVSPDYLQ